jgi:Zn-dependent protease
MIGVPIARILGIEVRVQLGWIFVVALVAALAVGQVSGGVPDLAIGLQWALGAIVGVAFFLSAMVHDLAHAMMARRRGVDVEYVVVSFFGGTSPLDPKSEVPGDELKIAASGPVVSIAIGVAFGAVALLLGSLATDLATVVAEITAVVAVLNLLIGLVNLVPAYPMDGGRIVRAIAWGRTNSPTRGWTAAALSGRAAGLIVVAIGAIVFATGEITNGAMVALSGWFLILSSRAIRERLKVDAMIGGFTVEDAMERTPTTISPALTVDTMAGQLLDPETDTTAVAVAEGDDIVGVVGVREVRRLRRGSWPTTRVTDVMVKPPRLHLLAPAQALLVGLDQLQGSGLDGIPVVDQGHLVGMLTRRAIGELIRAKLGTTPQPGRRGRF